MLRAIKTSEGEYLALEEVRKLYVGEYSYGMEGGNIHVYAAIIAELKNDSKHYPIELGNFYYSVNPFNGEYSTEDKDKVLLESHILQEHLDQIITDYGL